MFVLGLIMILLSAGALVAVLATGTDDKAVVIGLHGVPTLVVFLAGAAALLLFIMGLELVRSGVKRANQNRKNNRRLRRLEKQDAQRRDTDATPAGTTGPAADEPTGTRTGTSPEGPYQSPPPPH